MLRSMDYEQWQSTVSGHIKSDPLWTLRVYRMALFAGDRGAGDADGIGNHPGRVRLADQLRRAAESISANIAEGFSRHSARDRALFLEYALGSARETRDWYFKARTLLGPEETELRLEQLGHIIRILTALIRRARAPLARRNAGTR
jgi:four helix bundle protein